MLTDEGDLVLDPFAGSCITGEVSERLRRSWKCIELDSQYVAGARGRFVSPNSRKQSRRKGAERGGETREKDYYKLPNPSLLWELRTLDTLQQDGGRTRKTVPRTSPAAK